MAKIVIQNQVDEELTSEQLWRLKQVLPELDAVFKAKGGGQGNIEGLSKHIVKKLGSDPHLHTKCMSDEELAEYDSDARAAICAKVHYIATGMWPGEHGGKNKTGPEKKEFGGVADGKLVLKGGSGSGNFGHQGRPGKLGGSASGSGGGTAEGGLVGGIVGRVGGETRGGGKGKKPKEPTYHEEFATALEADALRNGLEDMSSGLDLAKGERAWGKVGPEDTSVGWIVWNGSSDDPMYSVQSDMGGVIGDTSDFDDALLSLDEALHNNAYT